MAKVGDIVRFLNTTGGGKIVRIAGDVAYVDEDGFETPVLIKDCVVVGSGPQNRGFYESEVFKPKSQPQPEPAPQSQSPKEVFVDPEPEEPYVETAEGETLNVVLGYVATDLKRLSQSNYEAYLVNDSNYYLYFTYLTRGNEQKGWTTRYAGIVEPGIQLFVGEVEREDLAEMDRVAVQYIPFKKGKEFALKAVACVEHKLDTTKFFKLHCFQQNPYFDEPAIALNIVRNDLPAREIEIDSDELAKAMRQKERADRQQRRPVHKPSAPKQGEPIVVDLHIAELVDTTAGLSNADMLNLQIDKFRQVMDANLRRHGQKIVFIHGKGEGVLRQAILKELNYRYKGHDVQDASFREYGFGATQVKIR